MNDINNFEEIFEIMSEAFPTTEIRKKQDQAYLFSNKYYKVITKKNESGKIIAFMAIWEFDDFVFLEHIAVSKNARSGGIGANMINELIGMLNLNKPFILEVEPPEDAMSIRRIGFYERLGFVLNAFEYYQPPLRKENAIIELKIMSYGKGISEAEFAYLKDLLYKHVYKIISD